MAIQFTKWFNEILRKALTHAGAREIIVWIFHWASAWLCAVAKIWDGAYYIHRCLLHGVIVSSPSLRGYIHFDVCKMKALGLGVLQREYCLDVFSEPPHISFQGLILDVLGGRVILESSHFVHFEFGPWAWPSNVEMDFGVRVRKNALDASFKMFENIRHMAT